MKQDTPDLRVGNNPITEQNKLITYGLRKL